MSHYKHILIVGPSGAGKTTLAEVFRRKLDWPVANLDRHAAWLEFKRSVGTAVWQAGGELSSRRYQLARFRSVFETLRNATSRLIIEGVQLLSFPALAFEHRAYLLDPPAERVAAQRLERKERRRANQGLPPLTPQEVAAYHAKSRRIYAEYADEVTAYARVPGVVTLWK